MIVYGFPQALVLVLLFGFVMLFGQVLALMVALFVAEHRTRGACAPQDIAGEMPAFPGLNKIALKIPVFGAFFRFSAAQ